MSLRSSPPARTGPGWPRVFVGGLLLWAACVLVTLATGNVALVPTLVFLGSFLVPVTFVVWAFGRWRDEARDGAAGRAGAAAVGASVARNLPGWGIRGRPGAPTMDGVAAGAR